MKDLLSKLRKLHRDQSGAVITAMLLVLVPMFIIGVVSLTEGTNIMRGADTTMQNAVTVASRQAAMMVDSNSQAKGSPLINHRRAMSSFLDELNYTLGHDTGAKTTIDKETLKYWVLVYNGSNTYKEMNFSGDGFTLSEVDTPFSEDVASYAYYSYDGSEVITNEEKGFPKTLFVSELGITDYQAEGSVKVTIEDPGVLVVMNGDIVSIMRDKPENVTRWAFAKIAKR